jgi:hypothetical protein
VPQANFLPPAACRLPTRTEHHHEQAPAQARLSRRWRVALGALLTVTLLTGGGAALLIYVAFVRPPAGNPAEFLRAGRLPNTTTLVVNAGASTTHASLSADYVSADR